MNEVTKLKKQLVRMEHRLEELQEEFDEVYERLSVLESDTDADPYEDEDDD